MFKYQSTLTKYYIKALIIIIIFTFEQGIERPSLH